MFFEGKGNEYQLLNSLQYAEQSITNFLLDTSNTMSDYRINLSIKSNDNYNFSIGYRQLVDFFKETCNIYCGFESIENEIVTAVVVFENMEYNHIHLLSLKFSRNFLWQRSLERVDADLFTYIRRDNVRNIFSIKDNDPFREKYKIKINN